MDNEVQETCHNRKNCPEDKRADMGLPEQRGGDSGRPCGERPYTPFGVSAIPSVSKQTGQYIKGNTSRKLQMEYKELNKQFWGQHLWARGYFVASSGNVTDEIIKEYIKNQDLQERSNSDNFEIGEK